MSVDFLLNENIDIQFDPATGDIATTDTLETESLCALFYEKRFNGQRGYYGFSENEGSKLWTLEQARNTTETLNNAELFARDALRILNTNVNVTSTIQNNGIIINAEIESDDTILRKKFNV